mmetsp:Transcript_20722/g.65153  ORF Transcript_20722/g.65153 Transcript_20722/m.65153 type:complete len:366 (+) Transcript_20722:1097-2194(+)
MARPPRPPRAPRAARQEKARPRADPPERATERARPRRLLHRDRTHAAPHLAHLRRRSQPQTIRALREHPQEPQGVRPTRRRRRARRPQPRRGAPDHHLRSVQGLQRLHHPGRLHQRPGPQLVLRRLLVRVLLPQHRLEGLFRRGDRPGHQQRVNPIPSPDLDASASRRQPRPVERTPPSPLPAPAARPPRSPRATSPPPTLRSTSLPFQPCTSTSTEAPPPSLPLSFHSLSLSLSLRASLRARDDDDDEGPPSRSRSRSESGGARNSRRAARRRSTPRRTFALLSLSRVCAGFGPDCRKLPYLLVRGHAHDYWCTHAHSALSGARWRDATGPPGRKRPIPSRPHELPPHELPPRGTLRAARREPA